MSRAVKRTRGSKDDPGIIRIDYPGFSGKQSLEKISWDEFFDKFDESNLAFLYQDKPNSRFSKLVKRETVAQKGRKSAKKKTRISGTKTRGRKTAARGRTAARKSAKKKRARA